MPKPTVADLGSLKFFAHPDLEAFRKEELEPWFAKVSVEKPKESRSGMSLAAHVLCGLC